MLSMFISPSAMVVVVVVNERAQSNVTDITSGHSGAADRLPGGGWEMWQAAAELSSLSLSPHASHRELHN